MSKLLQQPAEFKTKIQKSHGTLPINGMVDVAQVEKTVVTVSYKGESCILGDFVAEVIAYLLSYENLRSGVIEYDKEFQMDHCRLLCLLFLADWRSALLDTDSHEILTHGKWHRGIEGPYLRNLLRMAATSNRLKEIFRYDIASPIKLVFSASKEDCSPTLCSLTDNQKEVIRYTVDAFRDVKPDRLIELVYATDPLIDVEMHKLIDIGKFAARHIRLYGQLR